MRVRRASPDDLLAVESLHKRGRRVLLRMWPWEEHLTDDAFVVVERSRAIVGALLACPDESPVAWTRVAALSDELDIDEWLDLVLPPVLNGLRHLGSQTLAWMDYGGWAGPHLEARGFEPLTDVVTLAKFDRNLPDMSDTTTHLRPASHTDIPAVVAVDRSAFTPHWWQSEDTVRRRATASAHFVVAEVAGKVVGYAEADLRLPSAHLNRIAVRPDHQGKGVGASLLRDALRALWHQGAELVTLNTQSDNRFSQRLYRCFGFEATGDSVTVWELRLRA
jgi:ribosomal-protein-alanine N-acetyltransferase